MKKNIIVLGACGNIGMYFIDYLNNNLNLNNYNIIATGLENKYPFKLHDDVIEYVKLDITKKTDFDLLPQKNIHAVVDFAGILPAYSSKIEPEKYIQVNTIGTLNVLEYCKNCNVDRIIYTQTWADLNGYLKDKKPLEPYWPRKPIFTGDHAVYNISKSAAVDLIEHYHQEYNMKNFIFRLPNVYMYSPEIYYYVNGEKKYISYRYIIEKAIKGDDLELWGNPNCGKDILYVKDLCQMIYKSLFVNIEGGTYNAGTGIKTTMQEQIDGIIKVFSPKNKPSKIIYHPEKKDCDDFVMNIDNIKYDLKYEPKYDYIKYLKDYKKERNLKRFDKIKEEK